SEVRSAEEALAGTYAAILAGPVDPSSAGDRALAELRARLDLYVHLQPARLYDERLCPLRDKRTVDVDFIVVRDASDGGKLGGVLRAGSPGELAVGTSVSTRAGTVQVLRVAFQEAQKPGRRRRVLMVLPPLGLAEEA